MWSHRNHSIRRLLAILSTGGDGKGDGLRGGSRSRFDNGVFDTSDVGDSRGHLFSRRLVYIVWDQFIFGG